MFEFEFELSEQFSNATPETNLISEIIYVKISNSWDLEKRDFGGTSKSENCMLANLLGINFLFNFDFAHLKRSENNRK